MLQKKYAVDRAWLALARNIFGHNSLTAVMQQTLLVAWAQLSSYVVVLLTAVWLGRTAWCFWWHEHHCEVDQSSCVLDCQTMAELWGWAEHKCCLKLGALFFFWCACSLVLLMPRAEQIIYGSSQWVLPWTTAKHIALLHSCTLFIRGSGSKNTTQLGPHLHNINALQR